jgi:predicted SAM-dependent methyltransferase
MGLRAYFKEHTTFGFRQSLRLVLAEWDIQRRHRRGCRIAQQMIGPLKLNLGCGSNLKPGWVNADLFAAGADLPLDLREPLPFPDASVTNIYSEHFFEHLEYPREVEPFLKECQRLLIPGGLFSVGVPDTKWPLLSYANDTPEYFVEAKNRRWGPEVCRETRLHQINYHFRQGSEHKYAYDFETLAHVLRKAGFTNIIRRGFDPSLDTESRSLGTLYVDASKPHASSASAA